MTGCRTKVLFAGAMVTVLAASCINSHVRSSDGESAANTPADRRDKLAAIRQSLRLVHSAKVKDSEQYYFKGDTVAFNQFLDDVSDAGIPLQRFSVRKEYGKINNHHFDWVLQAPGKEDFNDQTLRDNTPVYPSVMVYAAASEIHLADVVLPEGAEVVVLDADKQDDWHVQEGLEIAKKWAPAVRKWRRFIGPCLSQVRQDEHDPSVQCVEMRSNLISEYLPDHIIYLIETTRVGVSSMYAVSVAGQVSDLGSGEWSAQVTQQYFRNEKLSSFLRSRNIVVADANSAVGITKLAQELTVAPGRAMMLRRATGNFTIFDGRLYSYGQQDENWSYAAKRQGNMWLVTSEYIGPPAMIMEPPKWELVTDRNGRFVELQHK